MTELKNFIIDNKNRKDKVGDICHDLLGDRDFTCLKSEEKQKSYIIGVGMKHCVTQDAIKTLFKEYSGQIIPDFED